MTRLRIDRSILAICTIAIALFISASCDNLLHDAGKTLSDAEKLMQQYPDSALSTLESILYPGQLSKGELNKYRLLQVQGRDKTYKDISGDTVIFEVADYYIKKGDHVNASLALLYSGQVRYQQKKYEEAMFYYLNAGDYANGLPDNDLKGLITSSIGQVYLKQLLKNEAKASFIKAAEYYRIAKNHKNEVLMFVKIGNHFSIDKEYDSAIGEYTKALGLADEYGLLQEQMVIRQNIGIAYREKKDFPMAKKYMNEALQYTTNNTEKAKKYLSLSKVFRLDNQYDSAFFYIQESLAMQSLSKEDLYLLSNTYKTLAGLYEERSLFDDALKSYKDYNRLLWSIMQENNEKAVLEVEKKYHLEVMQNENHRLVIRYQKTSLLFVGGLFLMASIAAFYYKKSRDNSKKAAEAEHNLFAMKEMAKSYNDKEKSFRNIVLHNFDVLRKSSDFEQVLARMDGKLNPVTITKEFNRIVYGQDNIDWDMLYQSMNEYHDRFFDRLKARYPELGEDEFKICCLTYAKFNSRQIGLITQQSINTIHAKSTTIRQKLGIRKFGNIAEFLGKMDEI